MRNRVIDTLFAAMQADHDIFFLTADMGINLVERFAKAFPDRFLNVGIAEQNLIGVAAGLANAGFRPFVYTISNFLIHRGFEQIRNDVVLHQHPVTLLGTSVGFDNAPLGPTHHIVDDWGALKGFAGIDIYCPSGLGFCASLVGHLGIRRRPAYVRIPKGSFDDPRLIAEDAVYLAHPAGETLLVCYGSTVPACLACGDGASVLVLNRLHPLPELGRALEHHARVLVVEDHHPGTGLYNSLCQYAQERQIRCSIHSAAPQHWFLEAGASEGYYHARCGMDAQGIRKFCSLSLA